MEQEATSVVLADGCLVKVMCVQPWQIAQIMPVSKLQCRQALYFRIDSLIVLGVSQS